MRRPFFEQAFIMGTVFVCLVLLLWIFSAALPLWLSDPYTYSAYREAKGMAVELESALRQAYKLNGVVDSFAVFATLEERRSREDPSLVNLARLAGEGVKIGAIDDRNVFHLHTIDSSVIELRWGNRHVSAEYRINEQSIEGRIYAIFNLGKTIDERIGN